MALRLLGRSMASHMRGLQINARRRGLNGYNIAQPRVPSASWSWEESFHAIVLTTTLPSLIKTIVLFG